MTNLVEVQYAQTGKSSNIDELGMREMQAMVYAQRHRQRLQARKEVEYVGKRRPCEDQR